MSAHQNMAFLSQSDYSLHKIILIRGFCLEDKSDASVQN